MSSLLHHIPIPDFLKPYEAAALHYEGGWDDPKFPRWLTSEVFKFFWEKCQDVGYFNLIEEACNRIDREEDVGYSIIFSLTYTDQDFSSEDYDVVTQDQLVKVRTYRRFCKVLEDCPLAPKYRKAIRKEADILFPEERKIRRVSKENAYDVSYEYDKDNKTWVKITDEELARRKKTEEESQKIAVKAQRLQEIERKKNEQEQKRILQERIANEARVAFLKAEIQAEREKRRKAFPVDF
jgi:hypothetical protein